MKALVYTAPYESKFIDVEPPQLRHGDVIVDVAFCGICGSDMHAWHGHDSRRVPPLVLGHEAVGIARSGRYEGRRVAINPLLNCGDCAACDGGASHLCSRREMIGMRLPGGFAESVAIREDNLFLIDDGLSFENASLAEPLACCVHAVRLLTADYTAGRSGRLVVLGGGAIGLLSAQVAIAMGYEDVWIAEPNPHRRAMLSSCVAGHVYDPIDQDLEPMSAMMVLDAVGSGVTRRSSTRLIAAGGVITHIGLQDNEAGLDTRHMTLQEVTFKGSYCYTNADFAEALSLLTSATITGAVITGEGFTEVRPLRDGAAAFVDIHEGKAPPKIILDMKGL